MLPPEITSGLMSSHLPLAAGLLAFLLLLLAVSVVTGRRYSREEEPAAAPGPAAADPFDVCFHDRRRAPRRCGNPVEVLVGNHVGGDWQSHGWVLGRSADGLCLMLAQPVEAGTVLRLRPTRVLAECPWVQVEIRHCRPRDTCRWLVGCKYVRKPAQEVRVLFG
jgi:hypothetical protein